MALSSQTAPIAESKVENSSHYLFPLILVTIEDRKLKIKN